MEAGSLILRKIYELNECSHTWGSLINPQIKYASVFIRNKVVFLEERAHPRSLGFFFFFSSLSWGGGGGRQSLKNVSYMEF